MKKNLEEKLEKHQRRSSIHTGMDKPARDLFSAEEKMLPVN
jgi:hypothetical protein